MAAVDKERAGGATTDGAVSGPRDAAGVAPARSPRKLFASKDKNARNPQYFRLQDLAVGYNGHAIIHDINIDIAKGDIVALIGPNGAGKSTILKSITRQLKLIGGTVTFDGGDLMAMSFKDLSSRMAVVLTERLHPELMTCHDIVATGRYPYTGRLGVLTRDDEDKVDEAMRAVHAEELGARDFNSISDGQRQRVLLARAICQEPDIILLDEPTSFLDVRYKLDLMNILRTMSKENGITVITSLHEIDLAMKVADKVVCVEGETIFRYGVPEQIFEEGLIRDLYGIEDGFFDPLFGSIELPAPVGEPHVMVVSSSGRGIPVYRSLQKRNEPFVAGILFANDLDYRLARLLAARTIVERPFGPIGDAAYQEALAAMEGCDRVIDAGFDEGPDTARLRDLVDAAERAGKLERWERA